MGLGGIADSVAALRDGIDAHPLPLVPSTLSSTTPEVVRLRSALRAAGERTTLLLPRSLPAIALSRTGDRWREIDADGRTYRIDARLVRPYAVVVLVDPERQRGPFVLDLPSYFLHPLDRARLATLPDRLRKLADVAAPVRPTLCLVVTPVGDGWLSIATRDIIAAELWALALAERYLDQRLEMQGPWEDPTVQRATELELGVRVPQEMELELRATDAWEPAARELLGTAANRLGMTLPKA